MVLSRDDRDLSQIALPRWGRVVVVDDAVPWRVLDHVGDPVGPIGIYRRFHRSGKRVGKPAQLHLRAAAVVALVASR